jgi:site-specific DNA-methyltransferase (adenine-specific)
MIIYPQIYIIMSKMTEFNIIHNSDCITGMQEIPDNTIDLVVTSPPYNVGIPYDSWMDKMPIEEYFAFMEKVLTEVYRILKPDGRIAINIPYEVNMKGYGGRTFMVADYYCMMQKIGFKFAGIVNLEEDTPHRVKFCAFGSWISPSAPYIYNPRESVLLMYKNVWKKQSKGKSYFTKDPASKREFMNLVFGTWKYRAQTRKLTEANFNISLPMDAIKILTYENDVVLDPFAGAGVTLVAAKLLNRRYIGFEISPHYCEIIKDQLAQTILPIQDTLPISEAPPV